MAPSRIHLSLALMSGQEQKYIREAFDTNWVAPLGPNVDAFEKALSKYLKTDKKVVALASGTAAIHLGLILLGVGEGDEVICQSFTFVASANPIRYLGASPVFVDSEKDTWNMSPVFLEQAIEDRILKTGRKPKAIIPVHLYGMPARMGKILKIATKFGIPVLEDAAEALGSTYGGKKCGTFGDLACLSFNGNKIITTSGGGALVCSTPGQAAKTLFYATQARDRAPHYQHSEMGYNYRMSNICAGIGRGQMTALGDFLARRRAIHDFYRERLSGLPGITLLENPAPEFQSNHWLTCIQVHPAEAGFSRIDLQAFMESRNIETRPLWKPMHLQPLYAGAPFYGDGTSEELFEKGLCLPSSPAVSNDDLERVIGVFDSIRAAKR
jgi:dTDP-4-amino-4,6-dideoxygalactose transaminase